MPPKKKLPKLDKNQQTIQFKSTSSGSENSVTELSQTVANKVGENEAANSSSASAATSTMRSFQEQWKKTVPLATV